MATPRNDFKVYGERDVVTANDLVDATKEVMAKVHQLFEAEAKRIRTETLGDLSLEFGRQIEKTLGAVTTRVDDADARHDARVKMLDDGLRKDHEEALKALRAEFAGKVKSIEDHHAAELKSLHRDLAAATEGLGAKVLGLQEASTKGTELVLAALKSLPRPEVNVTVPKDAIRVQQEKSVVNVSVPEKAIQIHQQPAQVSFTVPEKAIQVENKTLLSHPPPRKTRVTKSIKYGPSGRPETVEEETSEE